MLCRTLALVATLLAAMPAQLLPVPDLPCAQGTSDAGDHDEPCNDESPACATCLCCHVRAAQADGNDVLVLQTALAERLMPPPQLPALQPFTSGIFHPPRA